MKKQTKRKQNESAKILIIDRKKYEKLVKKKY